MNARRRLVHELLTTLVVFVVLTMLFSVFAWMAVR